MRAGARTREEATAPVLLLILMFALTAGAYFVWRYGGQWSEIDTSRAARAIHEVLSAGAVIPGSGRYVYPNGYGFQAISVLIISLTGLSIATLLQLVYPLVLAILVLPAFALYRELTGRVNAAAAATFVLFLNPEFLFVGLRSTHEKFTRTLMILALLILLRSLRLRNQPKQLAAHILLFYVVGYGVILTNNLMAISFIAGLMIALIVGWLISLRIDISKLEVGGVVRRLAYAGIILSLLAFIFTFYVYPPAQHDIRVINSVVGQLATMLLNLEFRDPYAVVEQGWISLNVYFIVSISNWIVLAASVIVWTRQALRWVVRRQPPPHLAALVWWLLYTSFAVQMVISIVVDLSGALSSNLQLRLFPSVMLVAGGLIAVELTDQGVFSLKLSRLGSNLLVPAAALLAVLGLLKATNEPLLSNKWTFYTEPELHAISWADSHLRESRTWIGFDERLATAQVISRDGMFSKYHPDSAPLGEPITHALISDVIQSRATRLEEELPDVSRAALVYDNGHAAIYDLTLPYWFPVDAVWDHLQK